MDHNDAISCQAATRYVAGELSPENRDAFEAHYFDCEECAEEVRWEQIFAANVRAFVREERAQPSRPSWWEQCQAWFRARPVFALSLAANAVLALGFGYLEATASRGVVSGPQLMASYFAAPVARSTEEAKQIPGGATAFGVHFLRKQAYPSYTYNILDPAGKPESAGLLKAPATQEPELFVEIPVGGLRAGLHTLVIRDNSGNDIVAQFQFRIS